MNILLLGGGGREHALAWKLSQSKDCSGIIHRTRKCRYFFFRNQFDLSPLDFPEVKKACLDNRIDMVVVGPEEPLVIGIVDFFAADPEISHIPVIGPSAAAAQLEGSKAFSKNSCKNMASPRPVTKNSMQRIIRRV